MIELLDKTSGNTVKDSIELISAGGNLSFMDHMYYEYEKQGIKVVGSRRVNSDDMMEEMKIAGENLRGEDVVIVDLRNNGGGSPLYPKVWLEGYLGYKIGNRDDFYPVRGLVTTRRTKTSYYLACLNDSYKSVTGNYEQFIGQGNYPYWEEPFMNLVKKPRDNKNTLFIVLCNSKAGSAGDYFVDFMRETENTIVVGTNSAGTYMTGHMLYPSLPYSHIQLVYGFALDLEPDLSSLEGIGFQPDIWCPPGDALDRVLKFIENNGLDGFN